MYLKHYTFIFKRHKPLTQVKAFDDAIPDNSHLTTLVKILSGLSIFLMHDFELKHLVLIHTNFMMNYYLFVFKFVFLNAFYVYINVKSWYISCDDLLGQMNGNDCNQVTILHLYNGGRNVFEKPFVGHVLWYLTSGLILCSNTLWSQPQPCKPNMILHNIQ